MATKIWFQVFGMGTRTASEEGITMHGQRVDSKIEKALRVDGWTLRGEGAMVKVYVMCYDFLFENHPPTHPLVEACAVLKISSSCPPPSY